jgi:hypothetical protein
MRVWFSGEGLSAPSEERGWVFAEARGAYAAVRVVRGGTRWVDSDGPVAGRWLYADDEYSPVVMEVAQKRDFPSSREFRAAVLDRRVELEGDHVLRFRGIHGDHFSFFADYSAPPCINDVPVNYAPARAFDSPFLQSEWNSGVITLRKGTRTAVLNFQAPE